MERIWLRRGGTGRRTPEQVMARLTIDWKVPEDLGPVDAVQPVPRPATFALEGGLWDGSAEPMS